MNASPSKLKSLIQKYTKFKSIPLKDGFRKLLGNKTFWKSNKNLIAKTLDAWFEKYVNRKISDNTHTKRYQHYVQFCLIEIIKARDQFNNDDDIKLRNKAQALHDHVYKNYRYEIVKEYQRKLRIKTQVLNAYKTSITDLIQIIQYRNFLKQNKVKRQSKINQKFLENFDSKIDRWFNATDNFKTYKQRYEEHRLKARKLNNVHISNSNVVKKQQKFHIKKMKYYKALIQQTHFLPKLRKIFDKINTKENFLKTDKLGLVLRNLIRQYNVFRLANTYDLEFIRTHQYVVSDSDQGAKTYKLQPTLPNSIDRKNWGDKDDDLHVDNLNVLYCWKKPQALMDLRDHDNSLSKNHPCGFKEWKNYIFNARHLKLISSGKDERRKNEQKPWCFIIYQYIPQNTHQTSFRKILNRLKSEYTTLITQSEEQFKDIDYCFDYVNADRKIWQYEYYLKKYHRITDYARSSIFLSTKEYENNVRTYRTTRAWDHKGIGNIVKKIPLNDDDNKLPYLLLKYSKDVDKIGLTFAKIRDYTNNHYWTDLWGDRPYYAKALISVDVFHKSMENKFFRSLLVDYIEDQLKTLTKKYNQIKSVKYISDITKKTSIQRRIDLLSKIKENMEKFGNPYGCLVDSFYQFNSLNPIVNNVNVWITELMDNLKDLRNNKVICRQGNIQRAGESLMKLLSKNVGNTKVKLNVKQRIQKIVKRQYNNKFDEILGAEQKRVKNVIRHKEYEVEIYQLISLMYTTLNRWVGNSGWIQNVKSDIQNLVKHSDNVLKEFESLRSFDSYI